MNGVGASSIYRIWRQKNSLHKTNEAQQAKTGKKVTQILHFISSSINLFFSDECSSFHKIAIFFKFQPTVQRNKTKNKFLIMTCIFFTGMDFSSENTLKFQEKFRENIFTKFLFILRAEFFQIGFWTPKLPLVWQVGLIWFVLGT